MNTPLVPLSPTTLNWPTPVQLSSFALATLVCLGALLFGLLPGLLALCLGYLFTAAMAGDGRRPVRYLRPTHAATVVILLPIVGFGVLLANAKGMAFGAIDQYQSLLQHLAGTVLEMRQKLPAALASYLPNGLMALQVWLADYLKSKSQALTGMGASALRGFLLVYVGLVVGALIRGTNSPTTDGPLRVALRQRGATFIEAFRLIVVAQCWIASINTLFTAVFLLVALPLFGVHLPYVGALVVLTFFAGLIPIVGNLAYNSVLTLAGVAVSPAVGLSCLLFLIVIHKAEYVINAKVLGKKTSTTAWELLCVMFVGEAVFGLPGLVAAPLYYACLKKELQAAQLV